MRHRYTDSLKTERTDIAYGRQNVTHFFKNAIAFWHYKSQVRTDDMTTVWQWLKRV
jgi:hypothetical protein